MGLKSNPNRSDVEIKTSMGLYFDLGMFFLIFGFGFLRNGFGFFFVGLVVDSSSSSSSSLWIYFFFFFVELGLHGSVEEIKFKGLDLVY